MGSQSLTSTKKENADVVAKDITQKGGKKINHWSSLTYITIELQKTRSAQLL